MNTLAFLQNIGLPELIVIMILGLLVFGKRLPEVGKSLGKGIVEFKKGLKGINDEVEEQSSRPARRSDLPEADRQYRAPLADGQERRVSRDDAVEETPLANQPRAEH